MENFRDKEKYYPTLVSNVHGKIIQNEGFEINRKIRALPQKTQDLLYSDEIVEFIYNVEQRYNLTDERTEDFSRTVRQYFLREITEGNFANKVAQLCNINPDEALKLLRAISNIIPNNETRQNNYSQQYIKLSLNKALEKYPQILKQTITTKNIITKPFLNPLKPTVKNWIMVYEKILGVDKHNAIDRGEFIFRSEATKGLTEKDRYAVAILLKSRDENTKLTIDPEAQKIIFTQQMEKNNENMTHSSPKITTQAVNKQQINKNHITQKTQHQNNLSVIQKQKTINEISLLSATKNNSTNNNLNQNHHTQQKDIKKVVQSEELEREILKSKQEVAQQKQEEKKWEKRTIGVPAQKKILTPSTSQKNNNDVITTGKIVFEEDDPTLNQQTQQNAVVGEISFSSNHTMPVELSKKTQKKHTDDDISKKSFFIKPIKH